MDRLDLVTNTTVTATIPSDAAAEITQDDSYDYLITCFTIESTNPSTSTFNNKHIPFYYPFTFIWSAEYSCDYEIQLPISILYKYKLHTIAVLQKYKELTYGRYEYLKRYMDSYIRKLKTSSELIKSSRQVSSSSSINHKSTNQDQNGLFRKIITHSDNTFHNDIKDILFISNRPIKWFTILGTCIGYRYMNDNAILLNIDDDTATITCKLSIDLYKIHGGNENIDSIIGSKLKIKGYLHFYNYDNTVFQTKKNPTQMEVVVCDMEILWNIREEFEFKKNCYTCLTSLLESDIWRLPNSMHYDTALINKSGINNGYKDGERACVGADNLRMGNNFEDYLLQHEFEIGVQLLSDNDYGAKDGNLHDIMDDEFNTTLLQSFSFDQDINNNSDIFIDKEVIVISDVEEGGIEKQNPHCAGDSDLMLLRHSKNFDNSKKLISSYKKKILNKLIEISFTETTVSLINLQYCEPNLSKFLNKIVRCDFFAQKGAVVGDNDESIDNMHNSIKVADRKATLAILFYKELCDENRIILMKSNRAIETYEVSLLNLCKLLKYLEEKCLNSIILESTFVSFELSNEFYLKVLELEVEDQDNLYCSTRLFIECLKYVMNKCSTNSSDLLKNWKILKRGMSDISDMCIIELLCEY